MTYAAPRLGITFLPLSTQLPAQVQQTLLEQAGIKHILCDNEISSQWPNHLTVMTIGQLLLFQFSASVTGPSTAADIDIPLMLATHYSTDIPRLVMLSHHNISAAVQTSNQYFQLSDKDCWLNCLPLYHINGLMILYRCLASTACVILHDRFEAEKVWQDLQQHPVSHLSLRPDMLAPLLDAAADQPLPASVKFIIIAGTADDPRLDPALAQRALEKGWPLYLTYGMTETCSHVAACQLEQATLVSPPAFELYDGVEVQINDKQCISLRSRQVMAGYANPPQASTPMPDESGWLLTQDTGRLDSEGRLIISGCSK